MKTMTLAFVATLMSAAAALADPVLGTWQTEPDDGSFAHVKMQKCGDAICGVFTRTFNENGEYKSPNIGKQVVRQMKPAGNGRYEGKVWRPSNNKVYIGKLDLNGNTLQLRGCVAGGLICAKQTWKRVN